MRDVVSYRHAMKSSVFYLIVLAGVAMHASSDTLPRRGAADMQLFGVEIGGPEDGFRLTDRTAFESARQVGARSIDIRPIWSALEPQPGVYDWSTLDAALENAASVGLPVTVTVRFFDDQVPNWLANENMLDQDGNPFFGYGFGGRHLSPSYWGPRARESYLDLVDALVQRYRGKPGILSWQFFYGYNDSFYMGMWGGRVTVYDYSEYSQQKYRQYLSGVKKLSLRELNKRYGMHCARWQDVSQPKPTFGELNVTHAWHDFQDYRMWSIGRMFDEIDRTVRRLDKRPLTMYYGGSLHHSAHELNVYDVGLPLLRKYGGVLDVTCFEDPVPAEVGAGIVRSYGVPLMCEAWQVPPPLKDFRRLFFHAFALGAKSYQLVGTWQKMEMSPEEFQRTRDVFLQMTDAEPIRAPVAGLVSYRTIISHVPARSYINPTLAMIPKLQEHQYSLDWHSDMSPLDDLGRYPALLDANSEVLDMRVVDRLVRYVKQGGRLALLSRSGRYIVGGPPDYRLLDRLQCPRRDNEGMEYWSFGKGHVARVGKDMDWSSSEGVEGLQNLMEWLQVERPITAEPGVLAALSRDAQGSLFATLFWPNDGPGAASFAIRKDLLDESRQYRIRNLFDGNAKPILADCNSLEDGMSVTFTARELKVLKISPE